jgi:outer membrane protein
VPTLLAHASALERSRDHVLGRRAAAEDVWAETEDLLERANRVVKQVAEAEKYDMVVQEAVYINPKHDITEKVLKALNAGAK